jgi:hypothetical protein
LSREGGEGCEEGVAQSLPCWSGFGAKGRAGSNRQRCEGQKMRWERIAWATVIAFLFLVFVSHIEDQTDSKEGFHLDRFLIILTVLIVLASWIAIGRKLK